MQVRYSLAAAQKIRELCDYYATIDPELRRRAMSAIVTSLNALVQRPRTGRPFLLDIAYRERVIRFGSSHFVALYRIDEENDCILIAAIRHEREMGYADES
jgi:plasmid stabilization system protein ParE